MSATVRNRPRLALPALLISALPYAANAQQADEIIVTATRQESRASELLADVSVVSREEIERSGAETVAQILARQPGIQISNNGGAGNATSVFIRGANAAHTVLLIDGLRVGSATLGTPTFEAIPADQIERIEILRGPASALYGADAIGGVIQIFTKKGRGEPRITAAAGYGSYDTAKASASIAGGSEAWSYSVHGSHFETDGFSAVADRSKQSFSWNPDRDGSWNKSVGANLAYRPATGHELGVTLLNSDSRAWYDSGLSFDNRIDSTATTAGAHARNTLSDRWTSTLRIGRTTDDSTNFASFARTGSAIRTDQDQVAWQNDVRLPVGSLLLGIETLKQSATSQGNFSAERRIDTALAGWTGTLGNHRLQANIRHDDNSQFGGKTTGLLAYGYQISDALRGQLSAGTAFRAPTFNQLYFPGFANPALVPEEAFNREAGISYEAGGNRASLTVFSNRVKNMIVSDSSTSFIPQNIGKARLEGISLGLDTELAETELGVAVDLQKAEDATSGQANSGKRLNRRAEKQLTAHAGRQFGKAHVTIEWQAVGARYDDLANRRRMGGYGLLNAALSYALAPQWTLEVRGGNLTDKRYETAWGFGTPGSNGFVGVRYASR